MAVVQISKIQHRRGRKGQTGIPQLASGELGWTVDTQELFIGNGSVAEGAPFVGNTKILTVNDGETIFSLIPAYKHTLYTHASPQTIQQRLEERVSAHTFGANGNNLFDNTVALQNALDDLYVTTSAGAVLDIPPGVYVISNSLKVPPNAVIRGAGKGNTIIKQTGSFPVFETVTAGGVGLTNLTQPTGISITDITFENTVAGQPVAVLNSTKNSYFGNVRFKGVWVYAGGAILANEHGVRLTAVSAGELVSSEDNLFEKCEFLNLSYAVHSAYDISGNTFSDCLFYQLGTGFYGNRAAGFAGQEYGPSNTKFINNKFAYITKEGINIVYGKNNLSSGNKFIRVGNNGGGSSTAAYPVVYFGEATNVSTNDYFERSVDLSSPSASSNYVGEFGGVVVGDHKYNPTVTVLSDSPSTPLLRLSAFATATKYRINYIYKTDTTLRQGVMSVVVNGGEVQLTDEYDFTGPEVLAENLSVSASKSNATVTLNYVNSGTGGSFHYWYEVIS